MEVEFERWAELPHGHLGSSQAEERGTCEVLRKQQRGDHRVGRKGGRKGTWRKRGRSNRLLGTEMRDPRRPTVL